MRVLDRLLSRVGLQRVPPAPKRSRQYAAADLNRLTADWLTTLQSANQDLHSGLRRLRGASRSLMRDTAYGARFVQLLQENVIGAKGIRLQARVGTVRSGLPNTRLNAQLEAAWSEWCEPFNASADGRLSFAELEALAISCVAVDGEALFRIVRGAENDFSFTLQILDADLLDHEFGGSAPIVLPSGNQIRYGIEENELGRPVAYWLWSAHPSDTVHRRERVRIPAEDIIHLFVARRPGQTRGVPWCTPVLINQKMAAGFQEAAVVAARFGASKMAVVTIDPEKAIDPGDPDATTGNYVDEVTPGGVWRANPGEAVSELDFAYPNTQFGEFMRSVLQEIAAGLGVAHASLSGDLSGVNYSSIRAGLLQERDLYRRLQQWLVTHFHKRIYREWIKYAPLSGRIPARESAAYADVRWQPRGWDWVDPLKDMQAAILAVQNGFATYSDICAESGDDFEENIERLAEEYRLAAAAKVKLGGQLMPGQQSPAAGGETEDTTEDDAEDTAEAPEDSPSTDASRARRLRVYAGASR